MPKNLLATALASLVLASTILLAQTTLGQEPATSRDARVPQYEDFLLHARSNFTGAFQLPDGAFFSSSTAALNDARQVAVQVGVLPGASSGQGIWLGIDGLGGLVYTSPDGAFLSDVSLGPQGDVVTEQVFSAQNGLYVYDGASGTTTFETNLPLGTSDWGSPEINATGQLGYRAGFSSGRAFASYDPGPARGAGSVEIHVADASIDATSPYSFLFTPSFDDLRRIAAKARLGAAGQVGDEQPDQIRIFAADGSSILIAEDQDSLASSPYTRFDNSVFLLADGRVAFVATLGGGERGVFLGDGATTVEIGREGDVGLSEVEFFAPAANTSGQVAFRGRDDGGLQALFVGDGDEILRLVGEHDLVETDLGTARIDQNDSSPVFGGGVAINERGDVAFLATLTPPDNDQIEWGTGLFLARATEGEIFRDDFEGGDATAWSLIVTP